MDAKHSTLIISKGIQGIDVHKAILLTAFILRLTLCCRFKRWVEVSGFSSLLLMDPSAVYQKYFVCSAHFDDTCFMNASKKRLKINVVPVCNLTPFMSDDTMHEYNSNCDKWAGKFQLKSRFALFIVRTCVKRIVLYYRYSI